MIYWFTGQPAHGKTTLARKLLKYHKDVYGEKIKTISIDEDDLQSLLNKENFYYADFRKKTKLAQEISHFMNNKGYDVYVSLISPYIDLREDFKEIMKGDLKEFYVYCSKEREKEELKIKYYQEPKENFILIDTTEDSVEQSLVKVLQEI